MILLGTILLSIYNFFVFIINLFYNTPKSGIKVNFNNEEILECNKLCCMSFNVNKFYNSILGQNNLEIIIDYLNNSNCDIICLQEVNFDIFNLVKHKYKNIIEHEGQVILTNHKVSNVEIFEHPRMEYRKQIYTPLITITIMMNNEEIDIVIGNIHFNNDFLLYEQHENLNDLLEKLENDDMKMILMGNTNIPTLKNKLKRFSTHINAPTYPTIYPYFQLDRFFYKNLSLNNYNSSKKINYSNHLPIYAEFN
jgi:endonuclease/exonuclease/phosphatase family metal-dependent hydrolase